MTRRILFALLTCIALVADSATIIVRGPASAPSQASYLVNQNFEGTGYDNSETWTESGTPDEDSTAIVLKGSQSFRTTGSSSSRCDFTGQTTVYVHFRVRFVTIGNTSTTVVINDAGDIDNLWGLFIATTEIKLHAGGSQSAASATAIDTSKVYYVWGDFVSGGTCVLDMSETSTRPTSDGSGNVHLTKTGASNTAARIYLHPGGGTGDMIVDNVLISTSPIGDNPNP